MNLWDFKAGFYEKARKLFPFNLILAKETANLKSFLSKLNLDQAKILDAGNGPGSSLNFWDESTQVIALDRSFKMICQAKLKGGRNFIVGDVLALPIKSDSFHLITAIGLLEYQKEKDTLLREFKRVVVPSGYLLLTYSQVSLLNFMRIFAGHRIYLQSSNAFNRLIEQSSLTCLDKNQSLIQTQVLLHDNSETRE